MQNLIIITCIKTHQKAVNSGQMVERSAQDRVFRHHGTTVERGARDGVGQMGERVARDHDSSVRRLSA